jgi:bifunctional non-homologous end joining protein LigD
MAIASITHRNLMLAEKSAPFSRDNWLFSAKFDGYRMLTLKDGKQIRLITRSGTDATTWYPQIVRSLSDVPGSFIMDCEVCAIDEHGRPDFEAMKPRPNGISNGRMAALFCFDLLYRRSDLRQEPLSERLNRLRDLLVKPRNNMLYVTHIESAGKELFEQAVQMGLEGVMAKKADSPYIAGRSRYWLKFKMSDYHDGWKRKGKASSPK